jgi:Rha family phage regulatory protein
MKKDQMQIFNQTSDEAFVIRNGKKYMRSLFIAKVTKKLHKNVRRDIKNLIEQGAIGRLNFEPSSYINLQGKKQPEYLLNFEATMVLLTGYDAILRAKVINEWSDAVIKRRDSYQIADPIERARVWITEEEKRLKLEAENKKLEKRARAFDDLFSAVGNVSLEKAAKVLNISNGRGGVIGRDSLSEILRKLHIFEQKKPPVPYQSKINAGYFVLKLREYTRADGKKVLYSKVYFTPKGLRYIKTAVENYIAEIGGEFKSGRSYATY